MRTNGIKASKLIKLLELAIQKYGDKQCWTTGQDYPSGVTSVYFRNKEDDGYYPKDVFVL